MGPLIYLPSIRSVSRYCHRSQEWRCVTHSPPSGLLALYPHPSLIVPCRSHRSSARLCLCWIYYICRDGASQLSTKSVRRNTADGPLALKISLGEMMSYLPIAGGHITMAERYVSKGFSFLLGWNYWYNWTIILPAELRFVRVCALPSGLTNFGHPAALPRFLSGIGTT